MRSVLMFVGFLLALAACHVQTGVAAPLQPGQITVGTAVSSQVSLDSLDRFHFEVSEDQFVLLRFVRGSFALGEEVNLAVTIRGPSGDVLEETNTASGSSMLALFPPVAGRYEIEVKHWNGADEGTYSLHIDTIADAAATPQGRISQVMDHVYDDDRPGAAVAIIEGGDPVFKRASGLALLETQEPLTLNTPIELASVSKQFTAFAIAMLVADGQLSLTQSVSSILPEMAPQGDAITIHHLVHHLSGLGDYEDRLGHEPLTHTNILSAIYAQPASYFDPGMDYRYSNSGYVLLAEIVERVTGTPFSIWMTENIFEPLDMDDSSIGPLKPASPDNPIRSYRKTGSGFDDIAVDPSIYGNADEVLGAIGAAHVSASLSDMIKWSQNYRIKTVGGAEVASIIDDGIIPEVQPWDYLFGLQQHTDELGLRRDHQGLTHGYRTQFVWYPERDVFFIYLANDGEWRTFYLAEKIIDLYFDE